MNIAMNLFLTSELLAQMDFYVAIVAPLFHQDFFDVEWRALNICIGAGIVSCVACFVLHYIGILTYSDESCPSAVIFNMTNNRDMAKFYLYSVVGLLAVVALTTLHVVFIAFRKVNTSVNPNPEKKTDSSDMGESSHGGGPGTTYSLLIGYLFFHVNSSKLKIISIMAYKTSMNAV